MNTRSALTVLIITITVLQILVLGLYFRSPGHNSDHQFPITNDADTRRPSTGKTSSTTKQCPDKQKRVDNRFFDRPQVTSYRIPRIIHQTSKSRCLTENFFQATEKWKDRFPSYEYYHHDDEDLMKLLTNSSEIPHLEDVSRHCLTNGALKADLWRYVLLYKFGGVYADIDTAPNLLNESSISPTDDALFVVEQFHMLSQWFIAVRPRHPLMLYAIHASVQNLLGAKDTGSIPVAITTGPHALHQAFRKFCQDGGITIEPAIIGTKPVKAGLYKGTDGSSVRVFGVAEHQNEYVLRDVIGNRKNRAYGKMGMLHFSLAKRNPTNISCIDSIRNNKM